LVEQNMRDNPLKNVSDVGIRVVEAQQIINFWAFLHAFLCNFLLQPALCLIATKKLPFYSLTHFMI
jgi:hypothetical protein